MDSFEINKLIGAFLGVVFAVFSIGLISDAIFAAPIPEKPGYAIEAAEEEGAEGGEQAPQDVPVAQLLASADPAKGEAVFKKCAACHTGENGGANKVGPNLWNIVNRPMATHAGFSYSAPMKEFSQGGSVVWDYDHLNHFLRGPKAYVKGTAMGFAGVKNDQERGDLIAYLRTLSDNPAPLPEAAPAPEGASAPAQGGQPAPAEGGAQPAPAPGGKQAPAEGGQAAPAQDGQPAPNGGEKPAPAPEGQQAPAQGGQPAPAQ